MALAVRLTLELNEVLSRIVDLLTAENAVVLRIILHISCEIQLLAGLTQKRFYGCRVICGGFGGLRGSLLEMVYSALKRVVVYCNTSAAVKARWIG